jgi:catechol 2,3-dioxygenase-like lactoylglutathione lyase family enzyme
VPAKNKQEAAQFFAEMFGLEVGEKSPGSPPGRFAVVRVGGVNFDFSDWEKFEPRHYAFHVSDDDFDAVFGRVKAREITYAADPMYRRVGEFNSNDGGRGVYFRMPEGHNLELLTRT